MTCELLVVFPAVFDQFSGRFSKEDNSVGFKIFKILISGCWCFKSAQKIAPATVGQRFTQYLALITGQWTSAWVQMPLFNLIFESKVEIFDTRVQDN